MVGWSNFPPCRKFLASRLWTAVSQKHTVAFIGLQSNGDGNSSGFDNFNGDYTLDVQYQYSTKLKDRLPGNYRVIVGASNKDVPNFDVDERYLIEEIVGLAPVDKKSDNYAFLLNFDQYLYVKSGSDDENQKAGMMRKHQPPIGFGLFGRAGWAPEDRNAIDQFYSFGIGGYGMLIPGRDYDQWGLGWSGTHISSDLRDIVGLFGVGVNDLEHTFEVYYNMQLTPAIHLTVNAQAIEPAVDAVDTAYTLGTRLQIDF